MTLTETMQEEIPRDSAYQRFCTERVFFFFLTTEGNSPTEIHRRLVNVYGDQALYKSRGLGVGSSISKWQGKSVC